MLIEHGVDVNEPSYMLNLWIVIKNQFM